MLSKQEVVAMLLIGGQGSRPGVLTRNLAKPAVPYGGRYRIIGFPLSNCVSSGIETVEMLTQYQPLVLNDYIDSGQPWDLDSMDAGVHMLAPCQRGRKADWYEGTANAIYQSIPFIERYHLDYVVILSGDHIYKMDYSKVIAYHKGREADCTITQIEVPWEEAPRFGILNTREDDSIYESNEKPEKPKSNKASMGIYIFSWNKLRKYLEQDEADSKSSNDFDKDLLPAMLGAGKGMLAYELNGYWRDVGTIENLWESNMDLLDLHTELDLDEPSWKIYSRSPVMSPHYLVSRAMVQNSLIAEGCDVYSEVDSTVLFAGTYITPGTVVRDSIVTPSNRVGEGAVVQYTIVSENAVIERGAVVGTRPEEMDGKSERGVAVADGNCMVAPSAIVPAKAMINAEEVAKQHIEIVRQGYCSLMFTKKECAD